jgi:hypothetical protein
LLHNIQLKDLSFDQVAWVCQVMRFVCLWRDLTIFLPQQIMTMERWLQDIKHIEQIFNPIRFQMTIQIKALEKEVHTLKVNLLDKQRSYEPP